MQQEPSFVSIDQQNIPPFLIHCNEWEANANFSQANLHLQKLCEVEKAILKSTICKKAGQCFLVWWMI